MYSSGSILRQVKVIGLTVVAGSLILTGCTSPADTSDAAPAESAQISTIGVPAINEDGVLSVCAALGMGAVPLFYFDENQEPSGIEVELSQAIAKDLGLEYREVATAFPSLVPSIEAKQCDTVMSSLFITEEREAVVDFVPYLESGSSLMALAGENLGFTGFDESLCGARISSPAGSAAIMSIGELSAECEASGKDGLILSEVDGAATGRQMLLNQQVDVYAGSTADTLYLVAQSDGELELVGEAFEVRTIGAAVRKGNTELSDAIASSLQNLKDDGTYEEILASVGLEAIAYKG